MRNILTNSTMYPATPASLKALAEKDKSEKSELIEALKNTCSHLYSLGYDVKEYDLILKKVGAYDDFN